jgi:DNA-binding XRE family transcriptional regulator
MWVSQARKRGVVMNYPNEKRDEYIEKLTEELPVLRARLHISQGELARDVGISRQTYSLLETGKQKMTWITFMAMIAYFSSHARTRKDLKALGLIDD